MVLVVVVTLLNGGEVQVVVFELNSVKVGYGTNDVLTALSHAVDVDAKLGGSIVLFIGVFVTMQLLSVNVFVRVDVTEIVSVGVNVF